MHKSARFRSSPRGPELGTCPTDSGPQALSTQYQRARRGALLLNSILRITLTEWHGPHLHSAHNCPSLNSCAQSRPASVTVPVSDAGARPAGNPPFGTLNDRIQVWIFGPGRKSGKSGIGEGSPSVVPDFGRFGTRPGGIPPRFPAGIPDSSSRPNRESGERELGISGSAVTPPGPTE